MWYYSVSCPGLFVCTAILCWNYKSSNISFFNITDCTPSRLGIKSNLRLIPKNHLYSITSKRNGFVCSSCTQDRNFYPYNSSSLTQCQRETTMIELRDYCDYSFAKKSKKDRCQCFPANYTIQPIREWAKALVKPGKSHMNTVRANKIKASSSISLYFFVSFIFLFVLLGGIAGVIFYWIKLKAIPKKTLK